MNMEHILFVILTITLMTFLGLLVIICAKRIMETNKNFDWHIQVISTFFAIFASIYVWSAIIYVSYSLIKQLHTYIAG